ncbi:MAG TPA: class I SAM-dependent methyltransferase [Syntrophomonadaceae bacterium]|nr:class I SAM-dependent methyltransferase [Syntrophomonadaceae bacterium]
MGLKPSLFRCDSQEAGPQYLEDLATGYWYSEVLFAAVEMKIFTFLESKGKAIDELAGMLKLNPQGLERFLNSLCTMSLLNRDGTHFFNTELATKYLVETSDSYQGESILWRKHLCSNWQGLSECLKAGGRVNFAPIHEEPKKLAARTRKYIRAMDCVAKTKVQEILPFFKDYAMQGEILDVGAGSGAITAGFLKQFPAMTATLMDLPDVLDFARELMEEQGLAERISYCQANILESWPVDKERYSLIILSNIIHAYSNEEIPDILDKASECLKPEGLLMIHDFFLEHFREKAVLFDLNMFMNTYNGMVYSEKWVGDQLVLRKLYRTGLIPLTTDTAVIFAAKTEKSMEHLCFDS